MFTNLLKDMIKDTDEQPDEQIHRQGVGVQELLSWWSWGASSFWYVDVFINLEALQASYSWDFMDASSCSHDQLTPSPAPLPSL